MLNMYDFHWGNAKYMNPSRATIPLIRPHQCDSDGGRSKRGSTVMVYCVVFGCTTIIMWEELTLFSEMYAARNSVFSTSLAFTADPELTKQYGYRRPMPRPRHRKMCHKSELHLKRCRFEKIGSLPVLKRCYFG